MFSDSPHPPFTSSFDSLFLLLSTVGARAASSDFSALRSSPSISRLSFFSLSLKQRVQPLTRCYRHERRDSRGSRAVQRDETRVAAKERKKQKTEGLCLFCFCSSFTSCTCDCPSRVRACTSPSLSLSRYFAIRFSVLLVSLCVCVFALSS